jgi:hypothetical protein
MRDLSAFYKELEETHGKAIAEATEDFFSIYTDGIYKWLAGLWDRDIGGFYYSNSARDNDGFLPDIESTAQALGHLEGAGIVSNMMEYPKSMRDKVVKFLKSKQDPDDGYFYHPQWGKEIGTSRRARDMNNALWVIKDFGAEPLYTPACDRIAEQMKAGTAESEVSTVPEHLRSKEAFIKYLEGLEINKNSYSVGHKIGAQAREIIAAGLRDVAYEFLNSTQKENGLWEDALTYGASNGLMKISCAYRTLKGVLPRMDKAFDASVEIALSPEDMYQGITCVYNPPFTILNLLTTMEEIGDTDALARSKKKLLDKAPELLRVTKEKVQKFAEPDGAFSYAIGYPSPTSQGMKVCVPGLPESDVNANSLASGSRTRLFKVLDIAPPPMFDEKDSKIFFELCGEK